VNNEVNSGTNKAGLKLMAGGPSKINPPNSHPSNPTNNAAQVAKKSQPAPLSQSTPAETSKEPEPSQHEINKLAVIIGIPSPLLISLV